MRFSIKFPTKLVLAFLKHVAEVILVILAVAVLGVFIFGLTQVFPMVWNYLEHTYGGVKTGKVVVIFGGCVFAFAIAYIFLKKD